MPRKLSNLDRHKQLGLLKAKRMSSQDKIKKVSKKAVETPLVVEDSDDDCQMNQIRRSKPK